MEGRPWRAPRPVSSRSRLTDDQRQRLTDLTRNGSAPAKKIRHARILLLADASHPDGRRNDEYIAEVLDVHVNTVKRTRWRFVPPRGGPGARPQAPRESAGPPQDRRRGRGPAGGHLLLEGPRGPSPLDDESVGRRADPAGRRHLDLRRDGAPRAEKNALQPWRKRCWCIPERDAARFVAQMEDVLDVYAAEHTEEEPADLHGRGVEAAAGRRARSDPRGGRGPRPRRTTTTAARGSRRSSCSSTRCGAGAGPAAGTAGRGSTGPRKSAGSWRRITRTRGR